MVSRDRSAQGGAGVPLARFPVSGWIFLGVFLLRLLVLVRLTDSQFLLPNAGDMQFYNNWALRILRGEWTDSYRLLRAAALCLSARGDL